MQPTRIKHFISVLGTSEYSECDYNFNGTSYRTRFVQEASLMLPLKNTTIDKITIGLTDAATEKNWKSTDEKTGLGEILKNKYGEKINIVPMVDGKNQEEIDEMFSKLYDAIGENEEVYFDITHGFRHLPMLVLTVLEYAKAVKNIRVGGIYYGLFNPADKTTCPLLDLTYYSDILTWSNAADVFIRYGNSGQINDLFSHIAKPTSWEDAKIKKKRYGNLSSLVTAINNITHCVDTGRGRYTNGSGNKKEPNSIQAAYEKYHTIYETIDLGLAENFQPLKVLLDKIDNKVSVFNKKSNLEIGLATIQWSIENEMIQQGYTALEETIKTYLCTLCDLDDSNRLYREEFAKNIINSISKTTTETHNIEETENNRTLWFDKWLDEMERLNNFDVFCPDKDPSSDKYQKTKEEITSLGKKLIFSIPVQLVLLSKDVASKRNDINHFGFSNDSCSYDKLLQSLKQYYAIFQSFLIK